MTVNCYWSKLAGSKCGYLDWDITWSATNINIVWKYSLVLNIVIGSVDTGIFHRCNDGFMSQWGGELVS